MEEARVCSVTGTVSGDEWLVIRSAAQAVGASVSGFTAVATGGMACMVLLDEELREAVRVQIEQRLRPTKNTAPVGRVSGQEAASRTKLALTT